MGMAKINKGKTVVILSGKDKGKTGEVTQTLPKDGKVVVAGVNIITRHKKPNQQDPQGGLERKEAPLHVSKVAVADPKTGKPTRVRFETKDGKKVRVAVKSGETINGCQIHPAHAQALCRQERTGDDREKNGRAQVGTT